ncbi:MAG: carboxypeptidase-like regulatory domain-containing protein, partial [Anaerolineales bacterium]
MMKFVRRLLWALLAFFSACAAPPDTISGTVVDDSGAPLAGAVVRVQTTEIETTSGPEGKFALPGLAPEEAVFVTAWGEGYYINGAANVLPGEDVEIVLQAHHTSDHPEYAWLPSQYHLGVGEDQGCAECHSSGGAGVPLPVDQWRLDAHANTASNPHFLTMYLGTDVSGNQSPQTRYATARDYGRFPLPPDLEQPYYGPGYKLDFPTTAGNCAACHTPAASVNNPYGVDPTAVSGVAAEGIPCDLCHKVWNVQLNPATGLPYANMPGVLSFDFLRPPEGHQFFAGPYDDV